MCGIFGIYLKNENYKAGNYILNGLKVLQHRGQDSAGICTLKNNKFFFHKNHKIYFKVRIYYHLYFSFS